MNNKVKISDLGEFGLIDRINRNNLVHDKNVIVSIGDDAAAIKIGGKNVLITTDTLVEDVHFSLKYFTFFDLGRKLAAVNLSDIAAMGGTPKYALVTLGLKKDLKVNDIDSFYSGIRSLANKYNVKVVGGDIVRSPKSLFFTMDVIGFADKVIKRSGAKPGDLIVSFGKFGGSSVGFSRSKKYGRKASGIKQHLRPEPMVKEGLMASRSATSMIDNSDGLARCLIEICKASKVGAKVYIDQVPLASGASFKDAFDGGEDYNLVLTVPRKKIRQVKGAVVIGEIVKGREIFLIDKNGKQKTLKDKGYEQI